MAIPMFVNALSNVVLPLRTGQSAEVSAYAICNSGTTCAYVQFFDAAQKRDVTLGTTTPTFVVGVSADTANALTFAPALQFVKGLCIAATGSPTGNDAPNAGLTVSLAVWGAGT